MKKLLTVLLVVVMASVLFANETVKVKMVSSNPFVREGSSTRDLITIFEEDFESGDEDWTHYDETAPTDWIEEWHLSTVGAYEGNSWWMGDEDLGGYTNHRYLVLDTPTITLAASDPELNFMFSLDCEDIGGAEPPYDAWDGANVRISTDGGTTWTPINGSPAYNGTSFYSFGYEFNEGAGIPAWGSTTAWTTWTQATFDLSSYAGESVKIRFAFASDPGQCTTDDPGMFGFRVDDIVIDTSEGTFESDGDGAAGDELMVAGYGGAAAGDLWHIYEDNLAPSPTNAMGCFETETESYYQNMSDFIISPVFYLPENGIFTWDAYVITMLDDPGPFPNCDYFHAEVNSQIPGEQWTGWNSVSNPLADPDLDSYVFTGSVETWAQFSLGWPGYSNITVLAGRNVKFRFGLHSNDEDQVVPGGIRIDDISVTQEVYLGPAPENLMAELTLDDQVQLTWDQVNYGGEEGWLQWDDGVNDDSIGLSDGGTMFVASRFDIGDMMPYVGGEISQLEIYINDVPTEMTLYIWEGSEAVTEVMSQTYSPTGENWNTIDLDTPVTIEGNQEYWIGYGVVHNEGSFPAGCDDGPLIDGKGGWMTSIAPTGWVEVSSQNLDINWNIHVFVESSEERVQLFNRETRDRDVTGYNIWRSTVSEENYEIIGTIEQMASPSYIDETPVAGGWNYYVVTALFEGEDGASSEEVTAYILPEEAEEIAYDDGTAEAGLNVGMGQYMAVKFTPDYDTEKTLTHFKVFVEDYNSEGQFVFRIFDDVGGAPGTDALAQLIVTPNNISPGWNTVVIPEENQEDLVFDSGSFYITIFEMASLSAIGKDTNNMGQSMITVNSVWEEVTDGNIMIRAILLPGQSEGDEDQLSPASVSISNYPNPFNPVTTIEMNIPTTGQANLNIYNSKGQLVKTLIDKVMEAGISSINWNGTDNNGNSVTSGVYFYKLETENQTAVKKMIMLK